MDCCCPLPRPMKTEPDIRRAWKQLCDYTEQVRTSTGVPGLAMAIVWLPEAGAPVVETQGFGYRKMGALDEVTAETVFPLASLSKPLASTVMTALVREGKIAWKDKVTHLGFANPPTFGSLFAHRSGLPEHAGDLLEDMGYDREAVLKRLHLLELDRTGGFAYTNFGLTAAACEAAERAQQRWEDLAHDRLYAPLGMRSTSSRFADFLARPNRTWGHQRDDKGNWSHHVQRNPDAQSPAGGVTSTANDMALWLRLQLGDPGLSGFDKEFHSLLGQTHEPYDGGHYGLGWNVSVDPDGALLNIGHSGAFLLGAATCVKLVPKDRLGIVVLTNGEPTGVPEAISAAFFLLAGDPKLDARTLMTRMAPHPLHPDRQGTLLQNFEGAMHEELYPPARSNDTAEPTRSIAGSHAFQGRYASAFYGTIEVGVEQGRLFMLQGPEERRERFELTPTQEEHVFVYDSRGENGTLNNRVAFQRGGPDGGLDQVTVWNLFAVTPCDLKDQGNTLCPVSGNIRAWRLTAPEAGSVRLTLARTGVDGFRQSPPMQAARGDNRFVGAGLEVREGDMLGFAIDDHQYWQLATGGYAVKADIDREGTFTRVA